MIHWIISHMWIISWAVLFVAFFCTNILYMSLSVPLYLRDEHRLVSLLMDSIEFFLIPVIFLSAVVGNHFYYILVLITSFWYSFSIWCLVKAARDVVWSRHFINKLPWKYVDRVLFVKTGGKERLLFLMRNGCMYEHHSYNSGWVLTRPIPQIDVLAAKIIKKKSASLLLKLGLFGGKHAIDKRKVI